MSSYKAYLSKNDGAIDAFQKSVASRVEKYVAEQDSVTDAVTDAQWKAFEDCKRDLILTLSGVSLSILRKVPKIQNEDTLGYEVQTQIVDKIDKYRAALAGADKENASIATYSAYLAAEAGLHKDKKDRPDDYPAALDEQRLASLRSQHAFLVKNSYSSLITTVVNTSTLLENNKELIDRPKRSYNTMM
ncbi:hypothetical protein DIPPA_31912 [Diplonema papillatum]|nr:hypothetical protein DIPPA_31912 [Diplonema papillatum]|eukprot:gene19691-30343_t